MKTVIKPSIHCYIYNGLLLCPLLLMTVLSIVFAVKVADNRVGLIICSAIFGSISIASLLVIIHEIQWVIVSDDAVTSKNIYGVVKTLKFMETRRILIVDAVAFTSRGGIRKTVPSIVISSVKSTSQTSIYYTANHKKDKYVILPYSSKNIKIIKDAYRGATGKDAIIE